SKLLADTVTVHHSHMPEIELTSATTAKGIWAMFDWVDWSKTATPERTLQGYGHYLEEYEKGADGRWRIKRIRLTRLPMDHPTPAPQSSPPATRACRTAATSGVSAAMSADDIRHGREALRHPCRFCARLTETTECPKCRQHHDTSGHFPPEVHWRQVPGQPRTVSRFCGECGRELSLRTTP